MFINSKHYIVIIFFLTCIFSSCQDFDQMNKDPNAPTPETVDPNFLLTPVLIEGTLNMHLYQRIHDLYVDCFSQYFSNDKYTTTNCVPVDSWTQDYWDAHWHWIDALNSIIRTQDKEPTKVNTVQIARIWKVWLYHRATDLWGDIPYFKAADGSGIAAPYDKQKDIYYDMFDELEGAINQLNDRFPNPGKNDLIFNGEIEKWRMFANALRLRLAMRLTEVDPQKAKAEAEAAVSYGKLPSSSLDNVTIYRSENYKSGGDMQYGNTYLHNGKRLTMSKSMEKILTGLGGIPFPHGNYTLVPDYADPRGPVYFNVTNSYNGANSDCYGKWTGVPSGLPLVEQESKENSRVNNARLGVRYITENSLPGPIIYSKNKYMTLMYYAEICFLKAEGAARGWNMGGTAQDFYEAGIRASMKETGIPDLLVGSYLTSEMPNLYGTTVKYAHLKGNNNSLLDKIITQKYLANFPDNSWEAWNDYRRLNLPNLDPFLAPQEGYVVEIGARDWKGSVRRIPYPPQETILNKANYEDAVRRIGSDKTTTRVWWDAKKP